MASRPTIIQNACDAIVRTSHVTGADCDALAAALTAKNAELEDPTVYDAAFLSVNAIAVKLGASTYGQYN